MRRLVVMFLLACGGLGALAAGLPGIWAELEDGQGAGGGVRPNAGASGGQEVAWWGAAGHWRAVTVTVPEALPQSVVYLRYIPLRKDGGSIDLYLAPATAKTKDDPAARKVGSYSGVPGGGYRWEALGAGPVPAGEYKLFLHCPGPAGNEFLLDVLVLAPAIERGLWLPPNRVETGVIFGPPTVRPPVVIAPTAWTAEEGYYRLPADGTPVTPGLRYRVTNNIPIEPVRLDAHFTLRAHDGALRWEQGVSARLQPGETFAGELALPVANTSTCQILTAEYRLNGASIKTEEIPFSVRKPVTTLAEMCDAQGTLLPGCYEGNLKLTAPAVLKAEVPGAVVLFGSIEVSKTREVTLENLIVQDLETAKDTLLRLSGSENCRIVNCHFINRKAPDKSPGPSVLAVDRCPGLLLERNTLLGNNTVATINFTPNLVLQGNLLYPQQFVGSQYGADYFFRQVADYNGLILNNCEKAVLEGNILQSPGRETVALVTRQCAELQARGNTYWGTLNFRAGGPFDKGARTLADWREWSKQDADSRMQKREYVRDALRGCRPDPRAALNGPPNVTLNLKALKPAPKPGALLAVGIFDAKDRLVRTLLSEYEWRGETTLALRWDNTDNLRHPVAPGAYTARARLYEFSKSNSWFGNSGGSWEAHMQQDIRGLYVTADGRCFTNCVWDEGAREAGVFDADGKYLAALDGTHGWFKVGGQLVTADDKYVYIDMEMSPSTDTRDFPRDKEHWFVVARYFPDGRVAPWPEGRGGWWKNMLIIGTAPCVGGLAARGGTLYVSDYQANVIRLIDRETMRETGRIPAERPGPLALDAAGNLWTIPRVDPGQPARVVRLSPEGKVTLTVTGIDKPTALCVDPRGRLLVTDDGPAQQVRIYDVSGATAKQVDTLGEPGGIYAGVPGKIGALRFNGLTGVGADAQGNIYVSSSRLGAELKKFSPAKTLLWNQQGLTFVDVAAADPAAPEEVFTANKHFSLDLRTEPAGWRYTAFTQGTNPDDPRAHFSYTSTQVCRINGKRFMYLSPMYVQNLAIFRFDGEQAVPAGMIQGGPRPKEWPPEQPNGRWIWRDANGDGAPQPGEMVTDGKTESDSWNWFVDSAGGIWRGYSYGQGILHLPCQGLDAHGNPQYDWAKAEVLPMPAPFIELRAVHYVPETDTLYLYGETAEFQRNRGDGWGPAGCVLARYDRKTQLRWLVPVDSTMNGMALAVADNLVFTTDLFSAQVQVFDAETGLKVDTLGPGQAVGWASGWTDFPMCLRAARTPAGEYLVFNEEDWCAKVMLYRLRGTSREAARVWAVHK